MLPAVFNNPCQLLGLCTLSLILSHPVLYYIPLFSCCCIACFHSAHLLQCCTPLQQFNIMNPNINVVEEGKEHGLQTATDNATDLEQILNERSGQGSFLDGRLSQPFYKHA